MPSPFISVICFRDFLFPSRAKEAEKQKKQKVTHDLRLSKREISQLSDVDNIPIQFIVLMYPYKPKVIGSCTNQIALMVLLQPVPIIYIGLFSYSFIALFHSSFIAFHLCMVMTWWYLQLHLGPPVNYLYGIAWLAKRSFSTKKQIPCLFRISSLGLVLANSNYRERRARDSRFVVVVVVGEGGLATRRVGTCQIMIHHNKITIVGRFFKTGVLVVLIKLEQCVTPATMLNVVPAISHLSHCFRLRY